MDLIFKHSQGDRDTAQFQIYMAPITMVIGLVTGFLGGFIGIRVCVCRERERERKQAREESGERDKQDRSIAPMKFHAYSYLFPDVHEPRTALHGSLCYNRWSRTSDTRQN